MGYGPVPFVTVPTSFVRVPRLHDSYVRALILCRKIVYFTLKISKQNFRKCYIFVITCIDHNINFLIYINVYFCEL